MSVLSSFCHPGLHYYCPSSLSLIDDCDDSSRWLRSTTLCSCCSFLGMQRLEPTSDGCWMSLMSGWGQRGCTFTESSGLVLWSWNAGGMAKGEVDNPTSALELAEKDLVCSQEVICQRDSQHFAWNGCSLISNVGTGRGSSALVFSLRFSQLLLDYSFGANHVAILVDRHSGHRSSMTCRTSFLWLLEDAANSRCYEDSLWSCEVKRGRWATT